MAALGFEWLAKRLERNWQTHWIQLRFEVEGENNKHGQNPVHLHKFGQSRTGERPPIMQCEKRCRTPRRFLNILRGSRANRAGNDVGRPMEWMRRTAYRMRRAAYSLCSVSS